MKTFTQYLTESQKTYEFKVKFANCNPEEHMDCLEACFDKYGLDSVTKPKSLPINEESIDFPSMKNPEIWVMETILTYPVQSDVLRALISERTGISPACISVVPTNHPEELWRNGEGELRQYKKGASVLEEELPETTKEQKEASEGYAKKESILKELSPKAEIAGNESSDGATTNDLPEGTDSPVGSKQNEIPTAK
jgi:hypothetical protein